MKFYKIFAVAFTIIGACGLAFGKPAMKGWRTVTQPDGTTLKIRVIGDENLHFTLAEDGSLLQSDSNGFYCLATLDSEGILISSGVKASEKYDQTQAIKISDLNMQSLIAKRQQKRRSNQYAYGLSDSSYPRFGNPKGLIILVEYQDVSFTSYENYDAADYFNDMINGDNFTQFGGTGSAKQYFKDQSGGQFIPDFDVLGPVTLPETRAFYGKNDRYGEDEKPHLMVTHAIQILDDEYDINFADYDTDGDGVIDNVYVFYAGQGEADFGDEDTVWPHSWDIRNGGLRKEVDGVIVGHYACSNEWEEKLPTGVGTFVHEFSHVMGLPDLYNTVDGNATYTPDEYSVLDYGPYNNNGRTPPNYGAFE